MNYGKTKKKKHWQPWQWSGADLGGYKVSSAQWCRQGVCEFVLCSEGRLWRLGGTGDACKALAAEGTVYRTASSQDEEAGSGWWSPASASGWTCQSDGRAQLLALPPELSPPVGTERYEICPYKWHQLTEKKEKRRITPPQDGCLERRIGSSYTFL